MILRIALVLILLLVAPALYIDRYFRLKSRPRAWRILLWGLTAAFLVMTLFFSVRETYSDAESIAKGYYLLFLLAWGVPALLFTLCSSVGLVLRRCFPRRAARVRRVCDWTGLVVALVVSGSLLYGNVSGPERLVVRHYTYQSASLPPAFNDYRIVQLSDLHVGTFAGRREVIDRVVDSVNALRPDLILFTGDLVNYHSGELDAFVAPLSRLRAKDGVMAVLGNHDYMSYRRWPEPDGRRNDVRRLITLEHSMGWQVLLNEHRLLRRGADSLAILGVENDGRPPFPSLANLPKAQRGLSANCFKVLMSHDPTHWRRSVLPETNINLTLSGHTHGMQFKIGHFSPAEWFYPEWGGAYVDASGAALYVSLGVGEVLLPFRLGAWPEINLITLQRAPRLSSSETN